MTIKPKDATPIILIVLGIIFGYWYVYSHKSSGAELLNTFQYHKVATKVNTIKKDGEKNKLKENNMNEYIKTDSGLEYKVIKMGNGEKPTATDTVEVHYEGKLENGQIFDSSYARGEKISFPLNQVISGWTEGLQLMPVGSEFEFRIPPELAYGDQALPGIPAGSTLIFKVELFGIK